MREDEQDDVSSVEDEREDIDLIFGERHLLPGESREQHNLLRLQIEGQQEPETFFDHLRVRNLTDQIWDAGRYKRIRDTTYALYRIPALEALFIAAGVSYSMAGVEAKRYFGMIDHVASRGPQSASEQEKVEARNVMIQNARASASQCKITADAITARALMMSDFSYSIVWRFNARRSCHHP